jgi:glutamate synthase domain-containing protein 3
LKRIFYTGSTVARFVLDDFENQLKNFVKVFPTDYKKAFGPTWQESEARTKTHNVKKYKQLFQKLIKPRRHRKSFTDTSVLLRGW